MRCSARLTRWRGRTITQPSAHWDWLPTFAAAAGLPPPARADGISLLPALTGQGHARERALLYFEFKVAGRTPDYAGFDAGRRNRLRNQMQAVRLGEFAGVRYDVKSAQDAFEICRVTTDPKETTNLALDPVYAALQARMQSAVLRSRRPDIEAPRPYDSALAPAIAATGGPAGAAWRAFAGPFPWVPDFAELTPVKSGDTSRPDLAVVGDAGGALFTGWLLAPTDGEYAFHLSTERGAMLRLHDATLLDADFGYAPRAEISATIQLQAGAHPFRLACVRGSADGTRLRLEWSGPGFARQIIPERAFVRPGSVP